MKHALLPEWTPTLLEFIARRSQLTFSLHRSLEVNLAEAYMQGMSDAVEAFRNKEG